MALYLGIKTYLEKRCITLEVIVCLLIIELASVVACLHWQSTLQPWPLPEAFELQGSLEAQLVKSLAIFTFSYSDLVIPHLHKMLLCIFLAKAKELFYDMPNLPIRSCTNIKISWILDRSKSDPRLFNKPI